MEERALPCSLSEATLYVVLSSIKQKHSFMRNYIEQKWAAIKKHRRRTHLNDSDSRYIPMDFHFGGQHTSLTVDEARGFGMWTRKLDLHVSTQLAGCYLPPSCWTNQASPTPLPFPPLPAFPFLSFPFSGYRLSQLPLLHLVAKIISLVSPRPYQTAFFIIQSRVPITMSHPSLPPPSHPFKAPVSGWFLP